MHVSLVDPHDREYVRYSRERAEQYRAHHPIRGVRSPLAEFGVLLERVTRSLLSEQLTLSDKRILRVEESGTVTFRELDGVVGDEPPTLFFEVKLSSQPRRSVQAARKQLRRARAKCREQWPNLRYCVVLIPWHAHTPYGGDVIPLAELADPQWNTLESPVTVLDFERVWAHVKDPKAEELRSGALHELLTGHKSDLTQPEEPSFGSLAHAFAEALK